MEIQSYVILCKGFSVCLFIIQIRIQLCGVRTVLPKLSFLQVVFVSCYIMSTQGEKTNNNPTFNGLVLNSHCYLKTYHPGEALPAAMMSPCKIIVWAFCKRVRCSVCSGTLWGKKKEKQIIKSLF